MKEKKKQGRPKVYVPARYVNLRVEDKELARILDLALDAAKSGERWPEFRNTFPTRSAILRLATLVGLKVLEERATASGPFPDYSAMMQRTRLVEIQTDATKRIKPVKEEVKEEVEFKPKRIKAKAAAATTTDTKDRLKPDETRALIAVLAKLVERLG